MTLTPELNNGLKIVGGIFWTITYLLLISRGFRDKSYGMPLVAICMNITWEFIFTFLHPPIGVQFYINLVWFSFDLLIAYQCLRYGRTIYQNTLLENFFYPTFVAILVIAFFGQYTLSAELNDPIGKFPAFSINLVMSFLFISMLLNRRSVSGQSIYIALFKMIGTILFDILFYLINPNEPFMNFTYATIIFLDLAYFVLLYRQFQVQKINPWTRRSTA